MWRFFSVLIPEKPDRLVAAGQEWNQCGRVSRYAFTDSDRIHLASSSRHCRVHHTRPGAHGSPQLRHNPFLSRMSRSDIERLISCAGAFAIATTQFPRMTRATRLARPATQPAACWAACPVRVATCTITVAHLASFCIAHKPSLACPIRMCNLFRSLRAFYFFARLRAMAVIPSKSAQIVLISAYLLPFLYRIFSPK